MLTGEGEPLGVQPAQVRFERCGKVPTVWNQGGARGSDPAFAVWAFGRVRSCSDRMDAWIRAFEQLLNL